MTSCPQRYHVGGDEPVVVSELDHGAHVVLVSPAEHLDARADVCLGLECGEPTDFDAMSEMIRTVVDNGVHVVFSSGNAGPEPGTIGAYHDASNGDVLVGAACKSVDSSRCVDGQQITDFSSRGAAQGTGPQVDVVTPGDTIMAALSPSVLAPFIRVLRESCVAT